MGCDIIAHVEKSKDGKHWEIDKCRPFEPEYNSLCIGRHYDLFYIMAGVRGHCAIRRLNGIEKANWRKRGATVLSSLGESRGFPEGSIIPDHDEEGGRNYSDQYPSWGNVHDLKLWLYLWKTQFKKPEHWFKLNPSAQWTKIVKRMEKLNERGFQSRFVFWFSY